MVRGDAGPGGIGQADAEDGVETAAGVAERAARAGVAFGVGAQGCVFGVGQQGPGAGAVAAGEAAGEGPVGHEGLRRGQDRER